MFNVKKPGNKNVPDTFLQGCTKLKAIPFGVLDVHFRLTESSHNPCSFKFEKLIIIFVEWSCVLVLFNI